MNRRHPLRALLAALVLSAVGLVIAAPAGADPHDDKAKVDGQLAKVHSLYEAASAQAQAALAAYNAGAGAVSRHGGVPPYRETQNYVRKVIGIYRALCGA